MGASGARYGGDGARSWLLIKHKDDWAGDVDIAEFAPRSVKSDGDFEDILAADNPDIWVSNRPAKGGETGAMLAAIIKKAAAIKAGKADADEPEAHARSASRQANKPNHPPERKRHRRRPLPGLLVNRVPPEAP